MSNFSEPLSSALFSQRALNLYSLGSFRCAQWILQVEFLGWTSTAPDKNRIFC